MSHSALDLHYVNGIDVDTMPPMLAMLEGQFDQYGYPRCVVRRKPASKFQYRYVLILVRFFVRFLSDFCQIFLSDFFFFSFFLFFFLDFFN
jgi:hypothetical protein